MALFSGGRYLRASLKTAGPDFWLQSSTKVPSDEYTGPGKAMTQPLHQFFNFPGNEDGEDIKREFKKRIADVDNLISNKEKDEIVKEAQHIFNFMVGIVEDLDAVCNTKGVQDEEKRTEGPASMRVEGGDMVSATGKEWIFNAHLVLRSLRFDARRILDVREASRISNFGMTTFWQGVLLLFLLLVLSLFLGSTFDDQRA
jgi:hypothetical protein